MPPIRMHSVSRGSGDKHIVILHGLLGRAHNWKSLQKTFAARLGSQYTVHALDLRNHGLSPHTLEHSISLMAEDCVNFCKGMGKVGFIGHSMGGKVAMELALTTDLVDRLLVVDVGPWKYSGVHGEMGVIETHLDAMRDLPLSEISSLGQASALLKYAAPQRIDRSFLLTNLWIPEEDRPPMWQIPLEVLKNSIPDIRNWKDFQGKFEGPTLFLGGSRSQYLREEMRDTIMHYFPKANIKWISGASHWVHVEKPGPFVKEAIEFFKD